MIPTNNRDLYTSRKILSKSELRRVVASWKKAGKTVGLCHGGFDLLHPGHVRHFESARKLCDKLIVSVTSDSFVEERKGQGRPIFSQYLRAYMVAGLTSVDYVVITNEARGVDVITFLKPSLYIKGPDLKHKSTPGISAERQAIDGVGGKIAYTDDEKLSTTEIINYIKKLPENQVLVLCDRDGTLLEDSGFLGRNDTWKEEVFLSPAVVGVLSYLATRCSMTLLVVTNQSGVARGFFDENRVNTIHAHVDALLRDQGIRVRDYLYCPDVDEGYARDHHTVTFKKRYVKKITDRKPSPAMVHKWLTANHADLSDFRYAVVIGNTPEDNGMARAIGARYLDVTGKDFMQLKKELLSVLGSFA